jgi:hypothetical protein
VPGSHPNRVQYAAKALAAYGGGQPVPAPASPAAPPSGLLASAPAGLGAGPQVPEQASGGLMAPPPAEQPMQMAQIVFPQRRMPDLSKLKAAFKAPTFYPRG